MLAQLRILPGPAGQQLTCRTQQQQQQVGAEPHVFLQHIFGLLMHGKLAHSLLCQCPV
jgi:hypothetical protein